MCQKKFIGPSKFWHFRVFMLDDSVSHCNVLRRVTYWSAKIFTFGPTPSGKYHVPNNKVPASLETRALNTSVDEYLAACPCLGGGCTSDTTLILPPSGETGEPLIDQRTGSGNTACDNITVHSISTLFPSF